ncbi:hypothetical protein GLYMA_04G029850v4 [Glycine max]|nr:hypothetical protein GLYMA_04G029850v4 [Glycine max]KAH1109507.1 hypothetical protein GYH30_008764 [Glycine max]
MSSVTNKSRVIETGTYHIIGEETRTKTRKTEDRSEHPESDKNINHVPKHLKFYWCVFFNML